MVVLRPEMPVWGTSDSPPSWAHYPPVGTTVEAAQNSEQHPVTTAPATESPKELNLSQFRAPMGPLAALAMHRRS